MEKSAFAFCPLECYNKKTLHWSEDRQKEE